MLRCADPKRHDSMIQVAAELVKLDGDAIAQPSRALSGGMKRRLSIGNNIYAF